jgi:hypothetical protein
MHSSRIACAAFALLSGITFADVARAEFPQVKINHIDASQAPKIRIWASVVTKGWKPPGDKDLTGITLYKKPDKGVAVELFGFEAGELVLPKGLSEEEKKKKEAAPPELALARRSSTPAATSSWSCRASKTPSIAKGHLASARARRPASSSRSSARTT